MDEAQKQALAARAAEFDELTEDDLVEKGGSCTQEFINGWNALLAFIHNK